MPENKSTLRFLYIINNERISVGFQAIIVGFACGFDVAFGVVNVFPFLWMEGTSMGHLEGIGLDFPQS